MSTFSRANLGSDFREGDSGNSVPNKIIIEMEIAALDKSDPPAFNAYMVTMQRWMNNRRGTRYIWPIASPKDYQGLGTWFRNTNSIALLTYSCLKNLELVSHGAPDEIAQLTPANVSDLGGIPFCQDCTIWMTGCNTGLGNQAVGKAISQQTKCRVMGTRGYVVFWSYPTPIASDIVNKGSSHFGAEVGDPIVIRKCDSDGCNRLPGAVDAVGDRDSYVQVK